jgi:pimeloyl-ACP methyl ester carboxylesterase
MKAIKWILICLAVLYACCVAYALVPQKSVPVQELAGANSHFIQVKGRQFHYEKYGAGKPIVLVHGFAGSTYTWRNVIPLLSQHYTVYAFDLPGFGLSDKSPEASYDMRSQATAVIDFIDALKLPSVSLVGHSMGGVIAGFAATLAPQKIEKAVIIDAGFYHGGSPKFFRKLFFPFDVIMARSFYTRGTRLRSLGSSYYNKAMVTDDLIDHYLRPTRTPQAAEALAKMMRTASGEIYEGVSTGITVPTLLIWARQDNHMPMSDADRLHREINNSQLVIIDQSGHMVQEEQPQKVAEAIRQFLQ